MKISMTEPNCTVAPIVVIKIELDEWSTREAIAVIDGLDISEVKPIADGECYVVLRDDIAIQFKDGNDEGKHGVIILKVEYQTNGSSKPAASVIQDAAREDAKGIAEALKSALSILE